MESTEKQLTVELVTLKTVVELGFKNIMEKLDGMLVKITAMEIRQDIVEKEVAAHRIMIFEGKENRLAWQFETEKRERNYVTRDQFNPVRNLIYGFTGLILTGVVIAILAMIIKK